MVTCSNSLFAPDKHIDKSVVFSLAWVEGCQEDQVLQVYS